jgi:nicotinate phosphoribosyltransferase
MNIDHTTKVIVYSDALNVAKALGLKKQCDEVGFIGSWPSTQNMISGDHQHP